ncbi:MAG: hypothetical protein PHS44_03085 [Candidatus Dojkabacteria bacterium]|jgi:hypothetical protein|nr:hypothetical protein [Candidatus Dojkabacteria bacterium]
MQTIHKSRKLTSFRPSIKITLLQAVVIITTLSVIAAVPVVIEHFFLADKDSGSVTKEIAKSPGSDEFVLQLPVTGTNLDLSAVKKNPQLITYAGLAFISIAILVGMSLVKNMLRKKSQIPSLPHKEQITY